MRRLCFKLATTRHAESGHFSGMLTLGLCNRIMHPPFLPELDSALNSHSTFLESRKCNNNPVLAGQQPKLGQDRFVTDSITPTGCKVKIFNSNVNTILLHSSESRAVTKWTVDRIQVFINKCLRRILNIH